MKKTLKIISYTIASLLLLLFILLLSLRLPAVQQKVTNYVTGYVSEKTATPFTIDRLYITFLGAAQLEGIYVEDQQEDTLLYASSLLIDVAWKPLMDGNINLKLAELKGIKARVHNQSSDSSFNYQFLIDAFANEQDSTSIEEESSDSEQDNSTPSIQIQEVRLENIDLSYIDQTLKMDTKLKFNTLDLSIENFNLDELDFGINHLKIDQLSGSYAQGLPFPSSEDSSSSPLPKLRINLLQLTEIDLSYKTAFDSLSLSNSFQSFRVKNAITNLASNKIAVESIDYEGQRFSLQLPAQTADTVKQQDEKITSAFSFPDYDIQLDKFDFGLETFSYSMGQKPLVNHFDPDQLKFQNIALTLDGLAYKKENLSLKQFKLSAQDGEHFILKEFSGGLLFNAQQSELSKLKLETRESILQSDISLSYASIDSLLAGSFYKTQFGLDINFPTSLRLKEAYYFSPDLKQDSTLVALAKHPLKLSGSFSGDESKLDISRFRLLYGKRSAASFNAKLQNWLDPEQLQANLQAIKIEGQVSDFEYFMPANYPNYYPQNILLTGKLNYQSKMISAKLKADLDKKSKINLEGKMNRSKVDTYQAEIGMNGLDLAKWLQDSTLSDHTNLKIKLEGTGLTLEELDSKAELSISEFSYNGNDFDTLDISSSVNKGQFAFNSSYSDAIIDIKLDGDGFIDSLQQKGNLSAFIKSADLKALGITDTALWMSTQAELSFDMDSLHQGLKAKLSETNFTSPQANVSFNPLKATLYNSNDSSSAELNWENIAFRLRLNHQLQELGRYDLEASKLQRAKIFAVDSSAKPMELDFSLEMEESMALLEFLPYNLNFEPIKVEGTYKSIEEIIDLSLVIPTFHYQNIDMDSIQLALHNTAEEFHINTQFKRIRSEDISIYPTQLEADITPKSSSFRLFIEDEKADSLFYIKSLAQRKQDSLVWSISPDKLILNGLSWNMDPANSLYFDSENVRLSRLIFERKKQKLELKTVAENSSNRLELYFEEFKIGTFLALVNAEENLVNGILKGELIFEDLNNFMQLSASLALDGLKIYDQSIGDVQLQANQESEMKYAFDLQSKGQLNFLSSGWVDLNTELPSFDIALDIDSIALDLLTTFSNGLIKESSGNLIGNLNIKGNTEKFDYGGKINFQDAAFFFPYLNMSYRLADEVITLKNEQIKLDKFTIVDEQNHPMQLSGLIRTTDIFDPAIDLTLTANNFQLLNTTKANSELFYGKAFFDTQIQWKGSLSQAQIEAKIDLNEKTDLVYIIPESEINVVEQQGIVRFKEPFNASDTLITESEDLSRNSEIEGLEVNAVISTHSLAKFKVIVDEKRGDYLTVSGESDLNFGLRKNGAISLNGNVEVNQGYYQLSLYDLVKRKFEIADGSRISWSGDPYEAALEITALFRTEAKVNALMEDQISSASTEVKNQYRQSLPFIVELFVAGNLSQPEISFGLNMPKDSRGALGGNVYQQIQSINKNETRLNKQVFSLLVLNQFFPSGSSGGGPNSEALARNSASQILSNQLNRISNQYVKGVDLNLDLDSYQDYQSGSAQDRTQLELSLSKNLFNDRFRVEVGSQMDLEGQQRTNQQATDIIGNVMVEYLLTEDGRYKLRGYRKNEYEGLIDGQVVVTGISLQFNKEFDKLKELWNENSDAQ